MNLGKKVKVRDMKPGWTYRVPGKTLEEIYESAHEYAKWPPVQMTDAKQNTGLLLLKVTEDNKNNWSQSAECQLNYNYRQCTKTSSGWIAIHLWNSRCSVYDQQSKRKGKTRIPWLCRINAGNFSGIRDAMCKCRRNRMVEGKDVQYGLPHRSPRYSQSK